MGGSVPGLRISRIGLRGTATYGFTWQMTAGGSPSPEFVRSQLVRLPNETRGLDRRQYRLTATAPVSTESEVLQRSFGGRSADHELRSIGPGARAKACWRWSSVQVASTSGT